MYYRMTRNLPDLLPRPPGAGITGEHLWVLFSEVLGTESRASVKRAASSTTGPVIKHGAAAPWLERATSGRPRVKRQKTSSPAHSIPAFVLRFLIGWVDRSLASSGGPQQGGGAL